MTGSTKNVENGALVLEAMITEQDGGALKAHDDAARTRAARSSAGPPAALSEIASPHAFSLSAGASGLRHADHGNRPSDRRPLASRPQR